MTLVLVSEPENELIETADAKQHLRILPSDFDNEIESKLKSARKWCESQISRTLRGATTRTLSTDCWWPQRRLQDHPFGPDLISRARIYHHHRLRGLQLPAPPLLTVTEVKYYDAANADQTLASSNYAVVVSTDGPGHIEWASTATVPQIYDRPDAVRITYTAGYTELPHDARNAILCKLTQLWGQDSDVRKLEYWEESARRLLASADWGGYG